MEYGSVPGADDARQPRFAVNTGGLERDDDRSKVTEQASARHELRRLLDEKRKRFLRTVSGGLAVRMRHGT